MISAALFDLDGTLLDRDTAIRRFAVDQYARLFSGKTPVPAERFIQLFVDVDQHGYVPKDRLYTTICAECNVTGLTVEELRQDFDLHFSRYYMPMPHLREMLDQLHRHGILLGIITNGRETMQMEKIRSLGIEDDFRTIVISGAVGMRKPEPAIFHFALEVLAVEAQDCVFVGDSPTADIRGAAAVGLHTIWIRVPYWPAANIGETPIDDLAEIPRILQSYGTADRSLTEEEVYIDG